jgi:hypothetical protein
MPRPRLPGGWSFIVSGALAASVAGHLVIQTLGERGRLETSTYGAYTHVALGPAIVFALVSALLATRALLRRRRRAYSFRRDDALVRDANAIVRLDWSAIVAYVAMLQLVLLYLMETLEHLVAFGSPTSGLDWLGGNVPVALAVHLALACFTAAMLRRAGRDLVANRSVRCVVTASARARPESAGRAAPSPDLRRHAAHRETRRLARPSRPKLRLSHDAAAAVSFLFAYVEEAPPCGHAR